MIRHFASKEGREALRNRWFLSFGISLLILTLTLSLLLVRSPTPTGAVRFGKTLASLVNLLLIMVPLFGLTIGAATFTSEKESGRLDFWLSQPLSHIELFLGKAIGLAVSLAATVLVSFGSSGLLLAISGTPVSPAAFLGITAFTVLLAWASLSIGLSISAWARSTSTAVALAIASWLLLGVVGPLGLMASTVVFRLTPRALLALALLNPLEAFRIGTLRLLSGSLEVLGPAGLYASETLGPSLLPLLVACLLLWILAFVLLGYRIFKQSVLQ